MKKKVILYLEPAWFNWNEWWILAFNNALLAGGIEGKNYQPYKIHYWIGGILAKLHLCRNIIVRKDNACIIALNWSSETRLFPVTYTHEMIPWITDCWPEDIRKWEQIFRRHHMKHVFFSSRDAVNLFAPNFPHIRFHWLPEAIDPTPFSPKKPLASRSIDVFEMGRSSSTFHEAIKSTLYEHSFQHLHHTFIEPVQKFQAVLADTKILVCFPKSYTHPKTIKFETTTARYFQGIASGCLLIGHSPLELVDLFGYNPVIEVEAGNEQNQLMSILSQPAIYQEFVHKNYARLLEVGTFDVRVKELLATLNNAGYLVATS